MAEALGTLASILQLVDTVLKAREYLQDFHNAPKEQQKLFSEIECLQSLLIELEKRAEGKPSSHAFQQMSSPLAAFKTTMDHVTQKLVPTNGLSKLTKRVTWTLWTKKEALGYIEELERIKALINIWVSMDIWDENQNQRATQDIELGKAEKRQRILDWMSPLNFLQRQADIFSNLQPGTGEWLLLDLKFQEWETGSSKVMLCRGIPGAGKTVVASLVVNHLEAYSQANNIGLACIYLNHKETTTQTITNLLGGLWRQLMLGKPIPPAVHTLYDYHHERQTRPQLEEVRKALDLAIAQYHKVYLIVDALDEYPEPHRHRFLTYLATLAPNVNILMTSRPHVDLDSHFPNLKVIEIYATEEDIHKYLEIEIQNSVRLSKHVRTRPESKVEIQSKIIENSRGMFLLAKLHIECLATKNTIKAVREALQHLPKDLQHTYDEAIERINHQTEEDKQLGLLALTWVANAKRPLSVAELREALAIEPQSTFLDVNNLLDIDIILSVCAGLIIVDGTVSVVRLVHYTAQAYLDSIQSQAFPSAHTIIVSTCLTYLSFREFEDLKDLFIFSAKRTHLIANHSFLQYAQYCLMHAKGQPELHLHGRIINFLMQAPRWDNVWPSSNVIRWTTRSPLCIAAAYNLETIARYLLAEESVGERKDAALWIAASYGHIQIIELIDEDANFKVDEAQMKYPGNVLQTASAHGHGPVVRLLIEKLGADVNVQGGYYGNALQAASLAGHESVVQILIEKGANVNAQGGPYGNALQAASVLGHEHAVQLLIESGANVNAQEGDYGNPLQAASQAGNESVVQILVEKGAEVNAQGGVFGNSLQAASAQGHKYMVQFLIEAGANVNAQGGHYGNALQAASLHRHKELVQILIDQGGDVNAQGGPYGSALQAAAYKGHGPVVQLLIQQGADVNTQGGYYGNVLQAASWNGHETMVQLLIEKGANVNAQGGQYGNALQAAAAMGHINVVQILLKNEYIRTAMQEELGQLIIGIGATEVEECAFLAIG
ncbi:ankyrin repeat domain-containing protein [Mycena latifolia]|nr:ankyrin repeat domain-containing protein [Mycena latifolia]